MGRGYNSTTYKYHVHGTLCGEDVDKKYCSLNEFIRQYGGEQTVLNLNKSKVQRLIKKWDANKKKQGFRPSIHDELVQKNWGLQIEKINEKKRFSQKTQ